MLCLVGVLLKADFLSVLCYYLNILNSFICGINSRNQGFFFKLFFFLLFEMHPLYLFIYLWLCWVFVSVQGFFLVVASRGHSSSWCAGLSLSWPLLLWSTGSRCAGSVIVALGPSRSVACGTLPDQGSNPCPPHWQADS